MEIKGELMEINGNDYVILGKHTKEDVKYILDGIAKVWTDGVIEEVTPNDEVIIHLANSEYYQEANESEWADITVKRILQKIGDKFDLNVVSLDVASHDLCFEETFQLQYLDVGDPTAKSVFFNPCDMEFIVSSYNDMMDLYAINTLKGKE